MTNDRLLSITTTEDIIPEYRNTPIGLLLEYNNLDRPYDQYTTAQLLIGMCMDSRKHLHIPDNFAFILRSGGANLRYSEFKVSYAIAIGGVHSIALIGHNNCGMTNLAPRKEQFITGLVESAGWTRKHAEEHFERFAPMYNIENEIDFIASEVIRLRLEYPKIRVAPMMYSVDNNKLYLINEATDA